MRREGYGSPKTSPTEQQAVMCWLCGNITDTSVKGPRPGKASCKAHAHGSSLLGHSQDSRYGGALSYSLPTHQPLHTCSSLGLSDTQGSVPDQHALSAILCFPHHRSIDLHCGSVAGSAAGRRAIALAELCGPYPGNLRQVCVHVLVADLHHLPDALIVAEREEGLWMKAGRESKGGKERGCQTDPGVS